jgi:hypothetical protein
MNYIRRALLTSALAVAACGIVSAGTFTETFSLPGTGSQSTSWSLTGTTSSYGQLQAGAPSLYGALTSVTISYSWASTGLQGAVDNNPGSTGDTFFFNDDTKTALVGVGGGSTLNLHENTAAGSGTGAGGDTGCTQTFTNVAFGQPMTGAPCVDTTAIEAASGNNDGAVLTTGVLTSGSLFTWAGGATTLSFTGTATTTGGISGASYTGNYLSGTANESVTVTFVYNAPITGAPEPATLFLMGSALVGVGLLRKRIKS